MSSCRGVLIAGVTNRARTQMAEGLLRAFTNNALFISSGAAQHGGRIHPLALRAMAAVGLPIDAQSCSSLEGARRQRATYDVYVSIDEDYVDRSSDRFMRRAEHSPAAPSPTDGHGSSQVARLAWGRDSLSASTAASLAAYGDPLLAPAVPAHWTVAQDATDQRQSWTLWSPRDPSIYHERSTRKFQDHLYEGEPLFMTPLDSELRAACRVRRRWEVPAVAERYAMETEAEQYARVVRARDQLAPLCAQLARELGDMYGETLLHAQAVEAYRRAAGLEEASATAVEKPAA